MVLLLTSVHCSAAIRDSFESGPTSWRLASKDCEVVVAVHKRSVTQSRSGQASELISVRHEQGTKIYFAHPVDPARVHDELAPTVWVRASQPNIQMLIRVVFPQTTDPRGTQMTCLLAGTSYQDVGAWQQLRISNLQQSLTRQLRVLRRTVGPDIDARGAYMDMLVLNLYSQSGGTDVWIDDLEVRGHISVDSTAPRGTSAPGLRTTHNRTAHQTVVRGSVLEAEGKPVFPRMIEHNGESLTWLHELGFNVVKLRSAPTIQQSREAKRLNIWFVAPPPKDGIESGTEIDGQRVLAWHCDSQPTRELETLHSELNSPLLLEASSEPARNHVADILLLDAGQQGRFSAAWFEMPRRMIQEAKPVWVTLGSNLASHNDPIPVVDSVTTIDPQRVRLAAYQAIAIGARGIYFRSGKRLDAADAYTRLHVACLRRLNVDLTLLHPWAAGGTVVGPLETDDPGVRVAVLQTPRSRLLLLLRDSGLIDSGLKGSGLGRSGLGRSGGRSAAGSATAVARPVRFIDPDATNTASAYRYLPSSGPVRIEKRRSRAGLAIAVSGVDPVAVVVVTQNSLVIDHLAMHAKDNGHAAVQLDHEIARLWLTQLAHAIQPEAMEPTGSDEHGLEDEDRIGSWASPYFRIARSRLRRSKDLLYLGNARSAASHSAGAMRTLTTVQQKYSDLNPPVQRSAARLNDFSRGAATSSSLGREPQVWWEEHVPSPGGPGGATSADHGYRWRPIEIER